VVPRVAKGGRSFKGAGLYYLHDKRALTAERVLFTETVNLSSRTPETALKEMAWTFYHQPELKAQAGVKSRGSKLKAPVHAYSLSWHPEQKPERAHMLAMARESLRVQGLEDHQALIVAHGDEPHPHVHVIVNRVHPETAINQRSCHQVQLSVGDIVNAQPGAHVQRKDAVRVDMSVEQRRHAPPVLSR
jgi:hypothetical protein